MDLKNVYKNPEKFRVWMETLSREEQMQLAFGRSNFTHNEIAVMEYGNLNAFLENLRKTGSPFQEGELLNILKLPPFKHIQSEGDMIYDDFSRALTWAQRIHFHLLQSALRIYIQLGGYSKSIGLVKPKDGERNFSPFVVSPGGFEML